MINYLKNENISFEIKDNTIIIDENNDDIVLDNIKIINCKVIFNNKGDVFLDSLNIITSDITFNNDDSVYLYSLTEITSKVTFNNKDDIYLQSLTKITNDIQFNNEGYISLNSLTELTSNIKFNNKGCIYLYNLKEYDAINLGREVRNIKVYKHLSKGYVTSLGCFVGTLDECIFAIENDNFYMNNTFERDNYIEGLKLAFSKYN